MTRRDTQADFATAGHALSGASLTSRPGALAFDPCVAFSFGPVAEGDPSEGAMRRAWRVRSDEGTVWISRADDANTAWEPEHALFTYAGAAIREVDLAFEQNARPVVAAERPTGAAGAAEVWLYRFDPRVSAFTFAALCPGRTPKVVLDDPRDPEESDVLLLYVSDPADRVEMRRQRDLYETVHPTPVTGAAGRTLEEAALGTDLRLQLHQSRTTAGGGIAAEVAESAPYPVRMRAEGTELGHALVSGEVRQVTFAPVLDTEAVVLGHRFPSATVLDLVQTYPMAEERLRLGHAMVSGAVVTVALVHAASAEALRLGHALTSGAVQTVVLVLPPPREEAVILAHSMVRATVEPA